MSKTLTATVIIKKETDKAILVANFEQLYNDKLYSFSECWLPKSKVSVSEKVVVDGLNQATVDIPAWLVNNLNKDVVENIFNNYEPTTEKTVSEIDAVAKSIVEKNIVSLNNKGIDKADAQVWLGKKLENFILNKLADSVNYIGDFMKANEVLDSNKVLLEEGVEKCITLLKYIQGEDVVLTVDTAELLQRHLDTKDFEKSLY
jgi:hypothetical protein